MIPYLKVPETREEVFAVIDESYNYPAKEAVKLIFTIYQEQHPEESVQDVWLRTLNHVIAIYEKR